MPNLASTYQVGVSNFARDDQEGAKGPRAATAFTSATLWARPGSAAGAATAESRSRASALDLMGGILPPG